MLGIHKNPNWKEFLISCESFLRKSKFSTLRYLNPGFNGLWDMLRILFVNVISIMLQKRSFRPEQILNFMRGFKSAILPEMKNCQNGTFEPMHGIQNCFWPRDFFWSIMKITFTKYIPNLSQGLPNPGFRSVRETEIFSWRTHKISKIRFNLGCCERLESKIRKCLFLMVHYCKNTVCISVSSVVEF